MLPRHFEIFRFFSGSRITDVDLELLLPNKRLQNPRKSKIVRQKSQKILKEKFCTSRLTPKKLLEDLRSCIILVSWA